MDITDFLTADRVVLDARPRDKPALIGEVARTFARLLPPLQPKVLETALLAREQLGSTGLGAGFALPHARIDGLDAYLGLFVRLAKPLDFEAIDGKPVRLVFVLLIPSETTVSHVAALAAISRRFRDPDLAAKLAKAPTRAAAFGLLTER
jgi:PTS system nitrogen regulatory IIA component